jgi:hypothetical protein
MNSQPAHRVRSAAGATVTRGRTRGPDDDTRLLLAEARRAYVPFSRFMVGTALETNDGTIVTGCNVENASYCRRGEDVCRRGERRRNRLALTCREASDSSFRPKGFVMRSSRPFVGTCSCRSGRRERSRTNASSWCGCRDGPAGRGGVRDADGRDGLPADPRMTATAPGGRAPGLVGLQP